MRLARAWRRSVLTSAPLGGAYQKARFFSPAAPQEQGLPPCVPRRRGAEGADDPSSRIGHSSRSHLLLYVMDRRNSSVSAGNL